MVEGIFAQVIFQNDMGARDPRGFAEKLRDVGGVMQHVDEEANIKGLIGKGELRAVEGAAWDLASWARNDFHTFDGDIRPASGEQAGDRAVSASNVQDSASIRWNQRRQRIG